MGLACLPTWITWMVDVYGKWWNMYHTWILWDRVHFFFMDMLGKIGLQVIKNTNRWWFHIFFLFHPNSRGLYTINEVGGGFIFFKYFTPYLGKIPILTHIFQIGWNHQLARYLEYLVLAITCVHVESFWIKTTSPTQLLDMLFIYVFLMGICFIVCLFVWLVGWLVGCLFGLFVCLFVGLFQETQPQLTSSIIHNNINKKNSDANESSKPSSDAAFLGDWGTWCWHVEPFLGVNKRVTVHGSGGFFGWWRVCSWDVSVFERYHCLMMVMMMMVMMRRIGSMMIGSRGYFLLQMGLIWWWHPLPDSRHLPPMVIGRWLVPFLMGKNNADKLLGVYAIEKLFVPKLNAIEKWTDWLST